MNELVEKLKENLILQLTKNEQIVNDNYYRIGDTIYSRAQLAVEIKNNTDIGVEMLTNAIRLAIDISSRK